MKALMRTLAIMVGVFFLTVWTINLYMLPRFIRNYGRGLGISLWKQWRW